MKLVEISWSPTPRQVRQFGFVCLIAFPSVGWLWGANTQVVGILLGIAAVVAVTGWLRPTIVRPLFVGMMLIAAPVGMMVGELAMVLIFFGVLLPISLIFRMMRRDALKLRMNRNSVTHWQAKQEPDDVSRYYQRY